MNDPTEFHLTITECQKWPVTYYADPDNPTPEEEREAEQAFVDWEARGGADLRKLRVTITAGPPLSFRDSDLAKLKRLCAESGEFLVTDDAARERWGGEVMDLAAKAMTRFLKN